MIIVFRQAQSDKILSGVIIIGTGGTYNRVAKRLLYLYIYYVTMLAASVYIVVVTITDCHD